MFWIQILLFIAACAAATPLLGHYMFKVYQGETTFMHRIFGWVERLCYRVGGIDPKVEMDWKEYLKSLLIFNGLGWLFLFLLQLTQQWLPLNPQNFSSVSWALAFNTASSFVTNTNWQAYAGETTLSYATQMLGLTVQNFLSAGTGIAAVLVLIRGLVRKQAETVGNFWEDLVRTIVYLLLPLSIIMALLLVHEGAVQTLSPYVEVTTLENGKQTIPLGPAASQIAIKQVGTNGGGFFNANSAHPFENPTSLSNFLEMFALFLIPGAFVYTYGEMIDSKKHGWLLLCVMFVFWAVTLAISLYSEQVPNPVLADNPVLEGKEIRLGATNSAIWSVTTTDTSNGSVSAMHTSLSPLAGGVALFNIMLGELIFGGIGVGLCGMIMFVIRTVFLAGLMVGRTPEYLGKKIEKREVQWMTVAVLTPGILILIGAGLSSVLPLALSSLKNAGPHGLSEILYAFTSTSGNNGSAFTGLNANTVYYNLFLGCIMLIARAAILVPSIVLGGILAKKKAAPLSVGTFSTNTLLFAVLLSSVILIVGALSYFPALALGPVVEHLLMLENRAF